MPTLSRREWFPSFPSWRMGAPSKSVQLDGKASSVLFYYLERSLYLINTSFNFPVMHIESMQRSLRILQIRTTNFEI